MIKTVNIDRIVRRKDFDGVKGLKVSTMFRTLQGEGPYANYPAVFLRLAGCNFGDKSPTSACKWCDTAFAIDEAKEWGIQELLTALLALEGTNPEDILVITGGEPTLQHNLLAFIKEAIPHFGAVQIETNGTQSAFFADPLFKALPKIDPDLNGKGVYTVVSPKAIYKSGNTPKPSEVVLDQASCFKFVLSTEEGAHHDVPEWAFEWAREGKLLGVKRVIYVSPMAVYLRAPDSEVASIWDDTLINKVDTSANYAYAAKYAMYNNLRLSLQTHLFTSIP